MKVFTFICIALFFIYCKSGNSYKPSWHFAREYPLTNVNPISITGDNSHLYISSGLKTEVHKMNYDGGLLEPIKNLRKPKYISMLQPGTVLVTESAAHVVSQTQSSDNIITISTNEFLDTPYGVSAAGNAIIISDYFKNRIYYNKNGQILSFGKPGIGDGEFNGPSDVQFANGNIYVSDSRNNRVQVFDDNGKFKFTFGKSEEIKTVGGIFVSNEDIVVTDYLGNRILIYDLNGKLKQTLTENFEQPSDAFIRGKEMFVVNYFNNKIMVFNRF